jgi:GH15 family glucan-1,4-alpha-glucosidase
VQAVERSGLEGPVERWRAARDRVHADVCARGWSEERGAFTQAYGSRRLDASLLLMPKTGFLPVDDPRVRSTVEAIARELLQDGFVRRYTTDDGGAPDGLPPGEGVFLACSFWLADCYAALGRGAEARELFERLVALRNDVGLLSEEYDPSGRRLVGNFPQAFSHVALVNTAFTLATGRPRPGPG